MAVSPLVLPDTDAEPGKLTAAAGRFEDLGGRITGTGGDLHSQIRTGATSFSELIAGPIRNLADVNKASWQKAVQGSTWGAAVTTAWSGNVTEFRERREELMARWTAAANADFGVTLDAAQPGMAEVKAAERFNTEVDEKAAGVRGEIMREFQRAWNKLEQDASERTTELKSGPTKATLATLMETGALGWAGFNLWGAKSPTPLDGGEGKKLADRINAALKRGELPSAADLANLNALMAHAAFLQKNGGKLSGDELDFLRNLYRGLDRKDTAFSNLIRPNWLEVDGADPADVARVKATLANGLLALSDEDLGGGYDQLPVGIREILDDSPKEGMDKGDWGLGLSGLAGLMAATGGKYAAVKLKGGTEFSALATIRVSENMTEIGLAKDEKLARGLLDVAFRNDKAAGGILTGKYDGETEYGKDTAEFVMRSLWSRDWGDQGKTVAGLVDWIPDAMDGKDPAMRALAQKSAFEVYTTVTNTERTRWDESAFEWMTDGFGRAGSDPAAPLATRNPYVTNAFGDMIGHDLDDVFGAPSEGVKNGFENGRTTLDWETRERLFQIALADEKTADNLGKAVYARVIADAGGIENWSTGEAGAYGEKNGTLARLLDGGVARLDGDTGDGLNDAADATAAAKNDQRITRWANMGAAVLKEVVLAVPGVDKAGDLTKLGTKVFFELGKTGPGTAQTEGWWTSRDSGTTGGGATVPDWSGLHGQIARSAVEGGGLDPEVLKRSIAGLDETTRNGLQYDDLVGRDGRLRAWDDIPPEQRRAASAAYLDTLPKDDQAAIDKYMDMLLGERVWNK